MTPVAGYDISKETFSKLSADAKLDVLFDMMTSFHDCNVTECKARLGQCTAHFGDIQKEVNSIANHVNRSLKINRALITLAALLGGWVGSLMNYLK